MATFSLGQGVLDIIANSSGLRSQIRLATQQAGAGQNVTVGVQVDGNAIANQAKTAASAFSSAFGKNLNFLPAVGSLAALAAAAVPATAAVLALGSSLGLAASAGAALLPAMMGAGLALGTVKLAFSGVTKAIEASSKGSEEYQKALAKLSPAGQSFTRTLVDMKSELGGLTRAAESATLPGFTSALKSAQKLIPDVTEYVMGMGRAIGLAVADMGHFAESPMFRGQLKSIMVENTKAADSFAMSAQPITRIIMSISEAAAPLASRFAAAFENGVKMVANWIELRRESGQLATFFKMAGDEMAKWFAIGKNLLVGIVALFAAANPAGRELSGTLEEISKKFKDWAVSEDTRQKIRQFFEFVERIDVNRIMGVAGAVTALGLAIKGMTAAQAGFGLLSTLAGMGPAGLAILAVAAAVAILAAGFGYLYATSEEVRNGVSEVGKAAKEQLGPVFERIYGFIRDKLVPVFKSALIGTLRELKDFLIGTLIPAIKEMYDNYLPKLEKAWNTITNAFKDNEKQIRTLFDWFKDAGKWLVSTLFPIIGDFAGKYIGLLAGAFSGIIKTIGWFVDVIHDIGAAFTWVKDATVSAWGSITSFLGKTWQDIKDAAGSVRDSVVSAFQWVWDKVKAIWDGITSAVRTAMAAIKSVFTTVWDAISSTVSTVMTAISKTVQFAMDIIKQLFQIAWNWIDALTGGKLTDIKNAVTTGLTVVMGVINSILESIKSIWNAAWGWVKSHVSATWDWIKTAVSVALTSTRDLINSVMEAIKSAWNAAWEWVKDKLGAAWDWISTKTSAVLGAVSKAVSTGMNEVKKAWDTSMTWINDKMTGFIKGVKDAFTGVKDHIAGAFNALPRAIVGALNAMREGINSIIGKINAILPGSPIPPLNTPITVPQGFATGGWLRGPGTGTSDSIPLMGSDGEFMVRQKAAARLAPVMPLINNADRLGYVVSGDPDTPIIRRRPGYADGGLISRTQDFIRSADPLPYVFGAVGPNSYDCSGLVGEVYARLTGQPSNRRYFTTYTLPGAGGFKSGHGTYTIGLSGEHVVGNLGGLAFEAASSQSGILTGSAATSVDRMPAQYYLPQVGDQFVGGGSGAGGGGPSIASLVKAALDAAIGPGRAALPQPGGMFNPIITGLFDQAIAKVRSLSTSIAGAASNAASAASGGANVTLGKSMNEARGWGAQWDSLYQLWQHESNWNHLAKNPSSGAYGIPQSLPASKMASSGADYLTNPRTQIDWGLGYIGGRYGDPNSAWSFWQSHNWYDQGGVLPPGPTMAFNGTGRNEQVLTPEQIDRLAGGTGAPIYHFAPGSITLDASKIKTVDDLLKMIDGLKSTARQYGARTAGALS